MGKINDKIKYPVDNKITANDSLIGSDSNNGGQTKNYPLKDIANFIREEVDVLGVDGTWVYSCEGDSYEYGNFYTPGVCFTGNNDPGFLDLNEIRISVRTIRNLPADKYLNLISNAGVMLTLINQNDLNNYLLIKDPTIETEINGYLKISFSDIYTSKSFKQGDEYSFKILGSSNVMLDLFKEKRTVSSNTTAPSQDNTVHIGQDDGIKLTPNAFYLDRGIIMFTHDLFTNINSPDRPSDPDAIKTFRMLCINNAGRLYPLEYGDVQPDWLDENINSRYHIKNRYAQKEINVSSYMLTASDNGHTIFINNGSGNCNITVNKDAMEMNYFRFCRFVQMGTGQVTISGYQSGLSITNVLIPSGTQNKIIGQNHQATLIRQVIQGDDDSVFYGDFYLSGGLVGSVGWNQETV